MEEKTHSTASAPEASSNWQFYLVMAVIAIGVLGLVAKVIGIF